MTEHIYIKAMRIFYEETKKNGSTDTVKYKNYISNMDIRMQKEIGWTFEQFQNFDTLTLNQEDFSISENLSNEYFECYKPPIKNNYKNMIEIIFPLELSVAHLEPWDKYKDEYYSIGDKITSILLENGWKNADDYHAYSGSATPEEMKFYDSFIKENVLQTIKQYPERKNVLMARFGYMFKDN